MHSEAFAARESCRIFAEGTFPRLNDWESLVNKKGIEGPCKLNVTKHLGTEPSYKIIFPSETRFGL